MRIRKLRMLLLLCVFSLVITANPVYADSREVAFKKFLKKMQKDFKSGKEDSNQLLEYQCADISYCYIDLDNDGKKELVLLDPVPNASYVSNRIYTYRKGKVYQLYDKKNKYENFAPIVYKVKGTKDFITQAHTKGYGDNGEEYTYYRYKKGEYYGEQSNGLEGKIENSYIYKKKKLKGKLLDVQNVKTYRLISIEEDGKIKKFDPNKKIVVE